MNEYNIVKVTPENVNEETLFCSKNIKSNGFKSKCNWFFKQYVDGLTIKILKDKGNRMVGFIEYTPAIHAWRPIDANNFMFIHCIMVYSKKDRNKGYGKILLNEAEKDAKSKGMDGVCSMSSKGSWIATKGVFENFGYQEIDKKGRFELLAKKWNPGGESPKFIDWTEQQLKYKGWNLIYANQCPWHEKSVTDLLNTAMDYGIDLKVTELKTAQDAQNAPSGYGTFSLIRDGVLLEDHYLSATRFRNILKKEHKTRQ